MLLCAKFDNVLIVIFTVNSVVQFLRCLNKYREYQCFNTSIKEVSKRSRYIAILPVLIICSLQLNCSIVDNYCTLCDSKDKAHHIKAC